MKKKLLLLNILLIMQVRTTSSLIGGIVAVVLGTACCWLPIFLVSLGAGTGFLAIAEDIQGISTYLMVGGGVLIIVGGIQLYGKRQNKSQNSLITTSTIICPKCSYSKREEMPTDACQYFYECENCHEVIKPKKGDCCVYCSYGDVPCPPIQSSQDCC